MRKPRTVPVKSSPTFAIVVDGDCEVWYFQMLKRNEKSLRINIEPKIPQKKSLSEGFETVQELSKDYLKVFWILDFDVILKETRECKKGNKTPVQYFIEYRNILARTNENVVIIVNNPCIEFWLLLHFESTSKSYDKCEAVQEKLKKYLTNYTKTKDYYTKQDNDIYLKLKPHLNVAIENAKKLGLFNKDEPNNAKAEMYLFFEDEYFTKNKDS